jgi:hypothetical protein
MKFVFTGIITSMLMSLSVHAKGLHDLKGINQSTSNDEIVSIMDKFKNEDNESSISRIQESIKAGQLKAEHKSLYADFHSANKLKLAKIFRQAVKESKNSNIALETIFFSKLSEHKEYSFLSRMKKYADFSAKVYDYADYHAIVFGEGSLFDDGNLVGIGLGISYTPNTQSLLICAGEKEFYGIGADVVAGFIAGVSFGSWIGNGLCVMLGAGSIYGVHARASMLMIY